MKKVIIVLCLLYAAESCAIYPMAVPSMPVVIHGATFWQKSHQDEKKECEKLQLFGRTPDEIEEQLSDDKWAFHRYTIGLIQGVIPGLNVTTIIDECVAPHISSEAEKKGFLDGLSLYATIPIALKWMKRIK